MSMSRCWVDIAQAARDGDTGALERLFELELVRQEIDATEALIEEEPIMIDELYRLYDDWSAWYNKEGGLFKIAVEYHQLDVLTWFFDPERTTYMHATQLKVFLLLITTAVKAGNPLLLEFLLESTSWSELFSEAEREVLLDVLPGIFSQDPSEDVIQTLLAHGMNVNSESVHKVCVDKFTASAIDFVVAEGVLVVGAGMLSRCGVEGNYSGTKRLLHYGADVSSPALFMTVDWNADYEMARILLEEGFADVDEGHGQDPEPQDTKQQNLRGYVRGRTPLMSAASRSSDHHQAFNSSGASRDNTLLTRLLLDYGADVTKRDLEGATVLHYTVDKHCLKMLLESGADPNARSHDGDLAIGRKPVFTEQQIAALLVLLEFGFDPFAIAHDGISTLERLLQTEDGAAFVEDHPEYFTRILPEAHHQD